MTGRKYSIFWLAVFVMLPGLLRGQCEPLPLPYTSDLRTGFHTPHSYNPAAGINTYTGWSLGANWDNCWLGYVWQAEDESFYIGSSNFGIGGEWGTWNYYCTISVPDSLHRAVTMLVAPEVEAGLASIGLTLQLLKGCHINHPVCTNYCAYIDYGWVRDVGRPMESFDMQGTLCIYTHDGNGVYEHNLSTDWPYYCFPVTDPLPAGSRFALRMRSELQAWPHPNGIYEDSWPYTFCIKEFTASNTVCNPALTSDTVHLSDSVCQHSTYSRYGIALSADLTADTGLQTFTMRDFEYLDNGNCHEHVKLLTLRVLPSDINIVVDSIFPGEAYPLGGRELTLAGNYAEYYGVNAYGCPIGDSLQLSIRSLPPFGCRAEIGVERTEYYISSPTEVHLWSVDEADRYLWYATGLTDDGTQRDAYVVLQPESNQPVLLDVERTDTVDHIYQGAAIDTSFSGTYRLTVPVEPQTRYRLVAVADTNAVGLRVQGHTPESAVWRDSMLLATFLTGNYREVMLTFSTPVPVHLSRLSLRRYCYDNDMVTLTASSLQPRIEADRTVICLGNSAVLQAIQTDYYRWESHPADTAVDSCVGCRSLTVSPSSTTTYYLLTPGGEVADSVTIEVQPYPVLHVVADREVVSLDNPVLTLEEQTAEVVSVRWTFSDGGEAEGRKVRWIFGGVDGDSLWVRVEGCTAVGCCTDSLLTFPVEILAAWFPNTFTPDGEQNNRFAMIANKAVEAYEMTIYNRQGLLVARCTDAAAGWDGRDGHGTACPQGVYTYICEYRLAGGIAKRYMGSVLLLR